MSKPVIRSGRFTAGADFQCGHNVVIDVAEEVIIGDRCVLPSNAYLSGRRVEIGSDFYGYSWDFTRLDVGRGRKDDEDAVLTVGSRCTFHNNRLDLARHVAIGDDVGLSPDVAIYTHGYWQSVLEGYPAAFLPVVISHGVIVGFRSVLLPGANVGTNVVIGAQAVVCGRLHPEGVYAGNPARRVRDIARPARAEQEKLLTGILDDYRRSCQYRGLPCPVHKVVYPFVYLAGCGFNVETRETAGDEDERSDDFRDFLFRRGIRLYTKRPFRRLGRQLA